MRSLMSLYPLIMLLMLNNAYACNDFYGPATLENLPIYFPPNTTMTYGITSFRDTTGCTLDCRCVYDPKTLTWGADTSKPKQTCVFVEQCKACKSTDVECKVGFIIPTLYTLYEATYYTDLTKPKMQQCIHYKNKPVQCEEILRFPDYSLIDHGSG